MKPWWTVGLVALLLIATVFGLQSCGGGDDVPIPELKIGVLCTLTGPAAYWGRVSMRSARVVADHYNEQGGIEIGGQRYRIRLFVRDDAFDSVEALSQAESLIREHGVRYIIGPSSDEVSLNIMPVLEAQGVVNVHYCFDPVFVSDASPHCILGMPSPKQSLPVIYRYLKKTYGVETVAFLCRNSKDGLMQMAYADELAESSGLRVLRVPVFDISRATYDGNLNRSNMRARVRNLVSLQPDAINLPGLTPAEVPIALGLLREEGFEGPVFTRGAQDAALISQLGDAVGIFLCGGGSLKAEDQSEYFNQLRDRYVESFGRWDDEAGIKLYALECLLRVIASTGTEAVEDTTAFLDAMAEFRIPDPFARTGRELKLIALEDASRKCMISVPLLLSKYADGKMVTVLQLELDD